MAHSKAIAKKTGGSYVARVNRVKLNPVDRILVNEAAGFTTHPASKLETRLSDNLLRAVMYVFRGFNIRQRRAEDSGEVFNAPTSEEVLATIMADRLVRQRIRDLVAQANATGMDRLPVKLPNQPESAACQFMEYVLQNLAVGFEDAEDNRPAVMPTLTPVFIGASFMK